MHKCDGCLWGTRVTHRKVLCMFSDCVKDKGLGVTTRAEETETTVPPSRVPEAFRRKLLQYPSAGTDPRLQPDPASNQEAVQQCPLAEAPQAGAEPTAALRSM